ncbi:hypothetical protein LTR78_004536 [Recurvomyces mirabilis]|uniref:Uncharacterized protein n=1 Tax=Recurvomyces mirabilis TaxID=574656 RepID=A0AAE0WPF7_9PEZI|nr:hypothetical protein LTR78_004536 [Recurvomyces mirabilis]KAK5152970.1 hypothetical protein LTS14_008078 [Recurvomyces mirabilis]
MANLGSKAADVNRSKPSPLLALPAELRLAIYKLVFDGIEGESIPLLSPGKQSNETGRPRTQSPVRLALLLTCIKIHGEASGHVYGVVHASFDLQPEHGKWLDNILRPEEKILDVSRDWGVSLHLKDLLRHTTHLDCNDHRAFEALSALSLRNLSLALTAHMNHTCRHGQPSAKILLHENIPRTGYGCLAPLHNEIVQLRSMLPNLTTITVKWSSSGYLPRSEAKRAERWRWVLLLISKLSSIVDAETLTCLRDVRVVTETEEFRFRHDGEGGVGKGWSSITRMSQLTSLMPLSESSSSRRQACTSRPSFLALPPEVRNLLYETIFEGVEDHISVGIFGKPGSFLERNTSMTKKQPRGRIALLQACKQIHWEADGYLYGVVHADFDAFRYHPYWLRRAVRIEKLQNTIQLNLQQYANVLQHVTHLDSNSSITSFWPLRGHGSKTRACFRSACFSLSQAMPRLRIITLSLPKVRVAGNVGCNLCFRITRSRRKLHGCGRR